MSSTHQQSSQVNYKGIFLKIPAVHRSIAGALFHEDDDDYHLVTS